MRQLVVTDAQNRILWVVGHRIDDRYKVTDATRNILCLEFFQDPSWNFQRTKKISFNYRWKSGILNQSDKFL